MIELRNLTKKFGQNTAVDSLSLVVRPGAVTGFLGPNGAGKTTTIRMIVGLMGITSGEILICGKNVEKDFEAALQNIGGIVENPELYKYLTGYQNLMQYARMVKGVSKQKVDEVVAFVGLTDRIHDKVKTFCSCVPFYKQVITQVLNYFNYRHTTMIFYHLKIQVSSDEFCLGY